MKTLQELYNEVIQSDALKKEFFEAGKTGKAMEFIKAQGCDATLDEIKAFLDNQAKADKELSVAELENAAGGTCNANTKAESVWSVVTVGIGCAVDAYQSWIEGNVGQQNDNTGRLCN